MDSPTQGWFPPAFRTFQRIHSHRSFPICGVCVPSTTQFYLFLQWWMVHEPLWGTVQEYKSWNFLFFSLFIFFLFFKDLFIFISKYTVAVFRCTRRGRQISLRIVVSHHVVAGVWTRTFRRAVEPSLHPSFHFLISYFLFSLLFGCLFVFEGIILLLVRFGLHWSDPVSPCPCIIICISPHRCQRRLLTWIIMQVKSGFSLKERFLWT